MCQAPVGVVVGAVTLPCPEFLHALGQSDLVSLELSVALGLQNPCGVAVNGSGELVISEASLDYSNVKLYQLLYSSSTA